MQMQIQVDYTRDSLFDQIGLKRLRESYMMESEQSPQDRFAFVSKQFGSNQEHAQRLYDYASQHWLSYSTPILSFGRSKRGLPISCFLNWMDDSADGLVDTLSETNWLSMLGGGVGIGIGIRSADDRSVGVMPHLKIYDASCLAYRQGRTRRGSYAMYLDVDHPDIELFIDMRKPTGDPNMRAMNLHHGINISDEFMRIIEDCMLDRNCCDDWQLKDPASGEVKATVSAKAIWQKILETRMQTGEPYIHFIDTANKALPHWLKDKGLSIKQSNLCSEIELPTDKTRTAVCCLSSVNLEYYDQWKDNPLFLRDVLEMLDNVLQYFIDNAPDTISRARFSAMRERSVGVGALGFHAYLQQKMIALESFQAIAANKAIFKNIRTKLDKANLELGSERGEAPDAQGTGFRLSHVMAIAPNASSSIIMGNTSPSIEPYRANVYRQDTLSGASLNKNKYLDNLLRTKFTDEEQINDIWRDIMSNDGSVQHLEYLTEHEKNVFKTGIEIDQRWIIKLASDRQQFIDQGQSINLFFTPKADIIYLHDVHYQAWKFGLKALYYCRSDKIKRADQLSRQIERKIIEEIAIPQDNQCLACEG